MKARTFISLLFAFCSILAVPAVDIFVSPIGDDSWSGKIESPNSSRSDGPFQTVERARIEVQDIQREGQNTTQEINVILRDGTYFLPQTLALSAEDSGTESVAITYKAYKNERPILSGGELLSGFKPVTVNGISMIATTVPGVSESTRYFTQLFVDGRRAPRTRLPAEGYYWIDKLPDVTENTPWQENQDSFIFKRGDLRQWTDLNDVDVVALHFWVDSRMPAKSVDMASRTFTSTVPSIYRLTDDFNNSPGRYYVENIYEVLPDQPGSWYLNRGTGVLTYHPLDGEDWENADFIIPKLEQLLTVEGGQTSDERFRNVTFQNLTFSHTEYLGSHRELATRQAATEVPAAVEILWSNDLVFSQCEISRVGAYAIEIGYGSKRISVTNCLMTDLGAGGAKIGRGAQSISITDNRIQEGGRVYTAGVGIWIGNSGDHYIAHNEIADLYYTGISVGWVWGYGLSRARNNIIEFNHLHHLGQRVLSDLGGVYTLGISKGTEVRNNLIHDIYSWGYGGWGLYTDEGSSYIEMKNNIVYNTKTGGFHQHYGRDNVISNNILAFAEVHQLQRTRVEEHSSFTFEKNIVYYNQGKLLGGRWREGNFVMNENIFWNDGRRGVRFDDLLPWSWRRLGHDKQSIVADPLFVNADKFDFTLAADSPAMGVGFEPFDLSTAGPRGIPGVR